MPELPLADLVRNGALDAELGALLWLLVEARVPVVVAGAPDTDRRGLRDAITAFLPPDTATVALAGDREDFAWMPEAVELGWRREGRASRRAPRATASPTVLVADLEDGPDGTWGERARIAIRSLSRRVRDAGDRRGDRLEDVFERLAGTAGRVRPTTSWRGSASS